MLPLFEYENLIVAGCDEAGRGCLAGPVVAAAAILPTDFYHPLLNDSKKLKEAHRLELRAYILEKALAHATAFVFQQDIDKMNILKASFYAMHLAVNQLKHQPEFLVIDGNRFVKMPGLPHQCIIKGDGKYAQIAAASVLAKTERDLYMENLHENFPHYHWKVNKGYPTPEHRKAIEAFGPCEHHRMSFTLLKKEDKGLF